MRVITTLGLVLAAAAVTASSAMACERMRESASSGQLTVATGPETAPPQTPILLPDND